MLGSGCGSGCEEEDVLKGKADGGRYRIGGRGSRELETASEEGGSLA